MALIDNQNKVIYWDEVNWQWLPFVTPRISSGIVSFRLHYGGSRTPITYKEDILNLLTSEGYILSPISNLGIYEISLGSYLYEGTVYKRKGRTVLKNLSGLLSIISGKTPDTISNSLKGMGVISKKQVVVLISEYKKENIEFRGRVYSSYSELSREYGFSTTYISKWLSKGLSLEEIVSNYKNNYLNSSRDGYIVDHLGTEYSCVGEMLDAWGITPKAYRYRKGRGWSIEKILTTPIKHSSLTKECMDFNGKIFPSIALMAKEYGVTQTSIVNHMKGGKTPAESLKHILDSSAVNRVVKDHLGNSFTSNTKMAKYWNVNYETFRDRIKRGWSLEEALAGKKGK